MNTSFSIIVGAVRDLLREDPPVSPNINRARGRVIPRQDDTAVEVTWDGAVPEVGVILGAPVDWQTRITVECYARAVHQSGDEAVDPLLHAVYRRLAENPTLGGLVFDIGSPVLEAEFGADGEKTGWVRMTYAVKHQTTNSTLEAV